MGATKVSGIKKINITKENGLQKKKKGNQFRIMAVGF